MKKEVIHRASTVPVIMNDVAYEEQYDQALKKYNAANEKDKLTIIKNFISKTMDLKPLQGEKNIILWFDCDERIWKENGAEHIKRMVEQFNPNISEHSKNEIVSKIYYGRNSIKREELNIPGFLVVKNGVLDLREDREIIIDYTEREDLLHTRRLNRTYDPDAQCPAINKFLREVCAKPQDIDTLLEAIGWTLTNGYKYQKAILLVGPTSTGKSTTASMIERFFEKQNCASLTMKEINEMNGFKLATLTNKFINVASDIPAKKIWDISNFKKLTGGDSMTVEKKFQTPYLLWNEAKLFFTANKIPPVPQENTKEWSRRWIVIEFLHKFKEDADRNKLEEITTEEELDGLLNRAIKGLQRLRDRGDFIQYDQWEETEELLDKWGCTVKTFIKQRGQLDNDYWQKTEIAYQLYIEWCEEDQYREAVEKPIFSRKLKEWCPTVRLLRKKINGKQQKIYRGIEFK